MKKQAFLVSAFIAHSGRVLLLKRSKTDPLSSGIWELPSGTIEFAESPWVALRREIFEETGLKIKTSDPFYIASYVTKHRDLLLHTIEISFSVRLRQNQTVKLNPMEHSEYRWVSKQEITSMKLRPSTKNVAFSGFRDLRKDRTKLSSG